MSEDKSKFEVGQIWETDRVLSKYVRIAAIDRKSNTHPIVVLYSADLKDEGIAGMRPDGSFTSIYGVVRVTKLYVPKKTMKQTLYLWQKPSGDTFISIYSSYGEYNKLLAKKEIELTEGEGLDV